MQVANDALVAFAEALRLPGPEALPPVVFVRCQLWGAGTLSGVHCGGHGKQDNTRPLPFYEAFPATHGGISRPVWSSLQLAIAGQDAQLNPVANVQLT
eukprot:982547-Pelagomonas_calceolata.AAC.4